MTRPALQSDPAGARAIQARFAELRAANRTFERLLGSQNAESHRLAEAIADLADLARTSGQGAAHRKEIDAQLDAAEASMRASLENLPLADLRRRVAAFDAGDQDDARALLEVLAGGHDEPGDARDAVECLVTLSTTEVRRGRRVVVRDPASLGPRLSERMRESVAAASGLAPAEAEAALLEAAARIDAGGGDGPADDVADLRSRLGASFWNPIVLRALVFYNARSWPVEAPEAHAPRRATRPGDASSGRRAAFASASTGALARVGDAPPKLAPESSDARPAAARPAAMSEAAADPATPDPGDDPGWPFDAAPKPLDAWPEVASSAPDAAAPRPTRGPSPPRRAPAGTPPRRPSGDPAAAASGDLSGWNVTAPERPPRPFHRAILPAQRRRPKLRTVALLAATALLVWANVGGPSGNVDVLGRTQLHAISPWLADGYRSAQGPRSIFIGTFDPAWERLTAEERERSGRDLTRRLRAEGVSQVLVYDQDRRLRVQVARGLPPQFGGAGGAGVTP